MAVQIIRINSQVSVPNQTTKIIADIAVSTVSELPAANGIDNYTLLDTSIALVRQTGDFYVLDGGTWYAADGSGAAGSDSTPNASVNSTRGLTKSAPATTKTLTNSLLDIEPEESEFVESKEVEVKDGGDSR